MLDETLPSGNDLTFDPMSPPPFYIGQLIDNKYQIISLLGRAGMGEVFRVKHTALGFDYALKTLDVRKLDDGTAIRRFQTEARATMNLKHPNLIDVRDFGVLETGQPYIVMELIAGQTLCKTILRRQVRWR